jgi:quercetin dioxygenase-like cupin family protein
MDPMLTEPMASLWAGEDAMAFSNTDAQVALRERLLKRTQASKAASDGMHTARAARLQTHGLAPGVVGRTLYEAPTQRALRAGEPCLVRIIELASGSEWQEPATCLHREWLVLRGEVSLDAQVLGLRDHHVAPRGWPSRRLQAGDEGATLFLRESMDDARTGEAAHTTLDAQAGWPDYAPGIQRRVMWQRDGQAAMLYHTQPGASIPLHGHGHDEECFMVQGELYLDDVLLMQGDYQLAPAGSAHQTTQTDTGVVLYAHGDATLQFR